MKFALTITDATATELAQLLAGSLPLGFNPTLGANVGTVITGAFTTPAADDDDNTPTNTAAPTVDSTGLPHDERIHSKAKTVTEAGAWRKRKGVSDDIVRVVEQELRARQPAAQPVQQPQPAYVPPQVTQPVPMPAMPSMPMPPAQQPPAQPQPGYPTGPGYPQQPGNVQPGPLAPSMPYQPQPPMQPAPQPAQPVAMDFNTFMGQLTQKMQTLDASGAPIIDAGYLASVAQRIGQAFQSPVNVITDISSNPAMVTYAIQIMQNEGKW